MTKVILIVGGGHMDAKNEIRLQILSALKNAKFPIDTPEKLIAAFPNGADTKCKSGNIEMTAGEAGKLLKASDFPFLNADMVANTIVQRAGL